MKKKLIRTQVQSDKVIKIKAINGRLSIIKQLLEELSQFRSSREEIVDYIENYGNEFALKIENYSKNYFSDEFTEDDLDSIEHQLGILLTNVQVVVTTLKTIRTQDINTVWLYGENIMKKSELIQLIKEVITESSYESDQLFQVGQKHDWSKYKMQVKFHASDGTSTKWLSIDKDIFDSVKQIISRQ